tara:strand:+ start:1467 stop:1655 length:189 start_codon:yes stop_codon:yes gene_type:complete
MHTQAQGIISHNDSAYIKFVNGPGHTIEQALNAIYNIPSPPYDDKFVVEINDIPAYYKTTYW